VPTRTPLRPPAVPALRAIRRAVGIREAKAPAAALQRDALYRRLLAVADVVSAGFAVWVCVVLLGEDRLGPVTFAALPSVVVASKVIGLYERDELTLQKSTLEEAPALFQLATLYALIFWLLEEVLIDGRLGDSQVLGLWGALFASLLLGRALARRLARGLAPVERCLVMGERAACDRIGLKLTAGGAAKVELAGCVPLDGGPASGVLREPDDFRALVEDVGAQRLIVAPGANDSDAILDAIRMAKAVGLKVSILPRVFEVVGSSVEFDQLEGETVLGIRRFGLSRSSQLIKRAFDCAGAAVALLVLAPALALIALAVRLDSRGPVLFRQTRVGRDGRHFRMTKFRTMVPDADRLKADLRALNETDGLFKIAADPRVTRIGRFLRRTSLDEFPQLINVLRGEMSLVGPRPLVVDEDRQLVGWHRRRLQLTPGMTGQWQVLGSARIPLREMAKIDYLYVANWSLWADVKILLRTVPYVVARRGM